MITRNRKSAIAVLFIILIGSAGLLSLTGIGKEVPVSDSPAEPANNQSFRIPDSVTFAGERVPVENFDTRESLERELIITAYRHSSTIMIIKRAARYFPLIEKILREYNIPDDFKYLVAAESDISNVISPAGATGYWQIMPETGKEEGLEISNEVDERYSIEASTRFACRYFLKSYDKYGNWTLAAASYNGGRNGLDEQIEIQGEDNYYDLLLNEETARYLFRVIAYKLVINDPVAYGFEVTAKDLYPPLRFFEVKIDSAVSDFSAFAKGYGTNYKMLKFLNPWLRKPYLTNRSGKSYIIKIPEEGSRIKIYNDPDN